MNLKVIRFSSQKDSTNGLLFDSTDGLKFLCYTLEDEEREIKVKHETRVPAGLYSMSLRDEGGMTERYAKKYGSMHKGMLCIHNKPEWKLENDGKAFQYILLHCGNTDEHTSGCLLVGDSQENNITTENGFIGRSTTAYKRVYPIIVEAIENGEDVYIEYIDLD